MIFQKIKEKSSDNSLIFDVFKSKIRNINVVSFHKILDENISLFEFFRDKMPSRTIVKTAMSIFSINPEIININNVLKCFREGNPEAYKILIFHPNGTEWLKKTIRELKEEYE